MTTSRFFARPAPMRLDDVAKRAGARLSHGRGDAVITGVAPLESAKPGDLTFLDNPKYARYLDRLDAAACLCTRRYADRVPAHVVVLESDDPYRAYAEVLAAFFPDAMRPVGFFGGSTPQRAANVHPLARLEEGVNVEPGAVIGAGAEIGRGTLIAAGAVIASSVAIGRDCAIGANVTIQHALIGDRVIIHPGAQIGQDGFGFALGRDRHRKVAQIGRVIIQDDVEIGANTTVDRGSNRDTVIGEGTKIDNQVQVGHNVEIGRHCVIVAQVGIAGSARLGDFVAIGGQSGVNGHVHIGEGAQVAAISAVHGDVPAGARYGGMPAQPIAEWLRELAAVRKLAQKGPRAGG